MLNFAGYFINIRCSKTCIISLSVMKLLCSSSKRKDLIQPEHILERLSCTSECGFVRTSYQKADHFFFILSYLHHHALLLRGLAPDPSL